MADQNFEVFAVLEWASSRSYPCGWLEVYMNLHVYLDALRAAREVLYRRARDSEGSESISILAAAAELLECSDDVLFLCDLAETLRQQHEAQ